MAGYSGTPLSKKLGIKPGSRLGVVNAPSELGDWLQPLPEHVETLGARAKNLDVLLFFTHSRADLVKRFPAQAARLQPAGGLWVCWPKKTSGLISDLDGNIVRETGLAAGLVDVKVCAVSDEWSGLRFVYRVKDRK